MVQKKFEELQKEESTPGKFPPELEEAFLANFNKNLAADLADRQNLSAAAVRKRQQIYAKNFKKDLKADLERRQAPPWKPGQLPENWDQGLVDNLNKNVLAEERRIKEKSSKSKG